MSHMTIWKFPLWKVEQGRVSDEVEIQMPSQARILHVGMEDHNPTLWALVNPQGDSETRRFRIAGTGHPISHEEFRHLHHLGTVQNPTRALVWHVFEIVKSPAVAPHSHGA